MANKVTTERVSQLTSKSRIFNVANGKNVQPDLHFIVLYLILLLHLILNSLSCWPTIFLQLAKFKILVFDIF
ncbi:hypothetical protein OUZ56_024876 [Daphnia magna]|uniref:Transmembrane protein n=1 Tax=Daphnia magna TaxID=35525 RepID=A0ABQ9ZIX1_9CRUS|nr:hypothetical protein OUZ56_024876 [Daphnia magna]